MGRVSTWLQRLRDRLSQRGYTCDLCGEELFDYPNRRVCTACEEGLSFHQGKTCPKCGRRVRADGACLACKSHLPKFTRAFSVFSYEGVAARAVNDLKNGKRYLAWYFGEKLAEAFLSCEALANKPQPWLLLPVPLTDARRKERGYNQAEELVKSMALALQKQGVDVVVDERILVKRRDEHMQKHLSSRERFQNAEGAYHVHKRKACRDKNVLLVDDILTTGATGSACAKALLGAGANSVYLFTVASTPQQK